MRQIFGPTSAQNTGTYEIRETDNLSGGKGYCSDNEKQNDRLGRTHVAGTRT